jgi:uncharacterized protein (DUF2147 family)
VIVTFRHLRAFLRIFFAFVVLPAWCAGASPAGVWRTIDDKTGEARSTVRIYEDGGKWFGRVIAAVNPAEKDERCDKCSGERKDQPVVGMIIMWGLTQHGGQYSGGQILDPETGTIYRCQFSLTNSGKRLIVRAYVGVSLLGRTQVWLRQHDTPP